MKMVWNKTKTVCTIGPACSSPRLMLELICAGMDIARFNFSHNTIDAHLKLIKQIQRISLQAKMPVGVLQDLPGPKIRIGELTSAFVDLKQGRDFFLTAKKISGTEEGVSLNDPIFLRQLKKNDILYLNDGFIKIKVKTLKDAKVICEILRGGRIYPKKGVSCPHKVLRGAVTEYDLNCLSQGLASGVDFVAVSFVQRAEDIIKVKNFIKRKNAAAFVIAKIERKVALEDIDRIIKVSDAVMVARGDLGIEADLAEVPFLQKEIIYKCNLIGRPVITATQMLESMVSSPMPTRAEATDVANAVIDGSDALMLSEETAVGKFPVLALKTMVKIAAFAEDKLKELPGLRRPRLLQAAGLDASFSRSAVDMARSVNAKLIVVPTQNANSIAFLSSLRSEFNILGITTQKQVYKKLLLYWGVYPLKVDKFSGLGRTLKKCLNQVKKYRLAQKHDRVVVMLTEDNGLFSSNIMEVRKIR